jgi:hypothetical protein
MLKLFLFFPLALFGKISFDFSRETPKVLRSVYPAIRAAEMPHEKKIYTKEIIQHTHVATGFQFESPTDTGMVDVSMNLGMSKKPLGVKESILCFSFPKVMMYKKFMEEEDSHKGFLGAGFSYNGLINDFSEENARALQAGLSMVMEFAPKNRSTHVFQIDFSQAIRQQTPMNQPSQILPTTTIEFCYGAGF